MSSNVATALTTDPPVALTSRYEITAEDRRYLDDQILGLEAHVVKGLIRGQVRTWFKLHTSSATLAPGDAFCAAGTFGASAEESNPDLAVRPVVRATSTALASAGMILGIATEAAQPGGYFPGAIDGLIGPTLTGLALSNPGPVRITSGRCERVASVTTGDYLAGYVDDAANLSLSRSRVESTGGGGGAGLAVTAPADVTRATAAVGVGTTAARADHKHDISTAIAGAIVPGDTAAVGTATSLARSDHKHSIAAFGSASGTFCQGNDSRLADDRTATGLRTVQTVVTVSAQNSPLIGRVLEASSSIVARWLDRRVTRHTSIPTTGHWQLGELLLWGVDASRIALRATRTGALGVVARANTTAVAENDHLSSGTRLFVVAIAGTTAGSLPGGLATAAYGDRLTDGTAVLECVGVVVQDASFVSIPNPDATAVALANSDATVNVADGPVFECATATANRTTTLGTTGAVIGDVMVFRQMKIVNFTWTFVSASGDTVVISSRTTAIISFVYNGTAWVVRSSTGMLS